MEARAQRSGCETRTAGCSPRPGKSSAQMSHCCLLIVIHTQRAHLVELAFLAIAGRRVEVPQAAGGVGVWIQLGLLEALQGGTDDFAAGLVAAALRNRRMIAR